MAAEGGGNETEVCRRCGDTGKQMMTVPNIEEQCEFPHRVGTTLSSVCKEIFVLFSARQRCSIE